MKKMIGALAVSSLFAVGSIAAELPIEVHGGVSAGYQYTDGNNEGFFVSNALVELSKEAKDGIGFAAAFGYLMNWDPSTTGDSFGLQYGYLSVPVGKLTIDAGVLPTMVGYEVANTYANPNINIATIWGGQPVYYGGLRATYSLGDENIWIEVNDDGKDVGTDGAWSVGGSGDLGAVSIVASYYAYNKDRDIVDIILSSTIGGLDVALNFDYQINDGNGDDGYGVAFYIIPKLGEIDIPIRIESFDPGDTGAYGDKGWDIAITPTLRLGNGYARAEVFYTDYDIAGSDTQVAVEFGHVF
ncbi:MAG: outer membrane beta-barrel protein [Aquificae bacterium]|nr:outer membrane beta-barrel protein [Aquificota bacterium]